LGGIKMVAAGGGAPGAGIDTPKAPTNSPAPYVPEDFSLALGANHHVYAWGDDEWGQLAQGTDDGQGTTLTDGSTSAGNVAWQRCNSNLSFPPVTQPSEPCSSYAVDLAASPAGHPAIPASLGITAIAAGWYHAMALDGAGHVWTWGANNYGQLGAGDVDPITHVDRHGRDAPVRGCWCNSTPRQVVFPDGKPLSNVVAIAAGQWDSIALDSSGRVWVWGENHYGQLGVPPDNLEFSRYPMAMSFGNPASGVVTEPIRAIASGWYTNYALDGAGHVWDWGANEDALGQLDGALGNPSANTNVWDHKGDGPGASFRPYEVTSPSGPLSGVTALFAGGQSGFALATTPRAATVWGWGYNGEGELGNGGVKSSWDVGAIVTNFTAISSSTIGVGLYHAVALARGGKIVSWGRDNFGQLGTGIGVGNCTGGRQYASCANSPIVVPFPFSSVG
jgi:alpha-tubulin suppressor-like RCC1 family protein